MKIIGEENWILRISQKVFQRVSIYNVFTKITLMAKEVHLIIIEDLLRTKFKSVFPYRDSIVQCLLLDIFIAALPLLCLLTNELPVQHVSHIIISEWTSTKNGGPHQIMPDHVYSHAP
jgi:hypothetical protein